MLLFEVESACFPGFHPGFYPVPGQGPLPSILSAIYLTLDSRLINLSIKSYKR